MLVNFKAEMWRKNISQAQICRETGISEKSMVSKIYERTDFTRSEMYEIHDKFFPETDFEYLYASDKEKRE